MAADIISQPGVKPVVGDVNWVEKHIREKHADNKT